MMKLVSYYENKFKLSRPENNLLPITKLPLELQQFTEKYFATENRPLYRPIYDPASPTVLGITQRPTPFEQNYQTTTLMNEMSNYDDLEHLDGPSLDYPVSCMLALSFKFFCLCLNFIICICKKKTNYILTDKYN